MLSPAVCTFVAHNCPSIRIACHHMQVLVLPLTSDVTKDVYRWRLLWSSAIAASLPLSVWLSQRSVGAERRAPAIETGRSAIAEGPRDALSELKSCQLLRSGTKNRIW